MPEYVAMKSLPQLAEALGVDRSTLVRLEQRGVIPKAPKIKTPFQGRAYDEALEKAVIKAFQAYTRAKTDESERPIVPSNVVIVRSMR